MELRKFLRATNRMLLGINHSNVLDVELGLDVVLASLPALFMKRGVGEGLRLGPVPIVLDTQGATDGIVSVSTYVGGIVGEVVVDTLSRSQC